MIRRAVDTTVLIALLGLLGAACAFIAPAAPTPTPLPPEWASFFTAEEYLEFERLVRLYFSERGVGASIAAGGVLALDDANDEWPDADELAVQNLAQICHMTDRSAWQTAITDYFDKIRFSRWERLKLDQIVGDFDAVSELLVVRVWPADYLEATGMGRQSLVFREDLEGTISALALEMPSLFQAVTPDEAAAWNVDTAELFRIALDNVRKKSHPQAAPLKVNEQLSILVLIDETNLVATNALLLDEFPECIGAHGAVVSVPQRDTLLCYPINDLSVTRAINALIPFTAEVYQDGPGSISPYLYWYRDGKFTTLPYEIDGQQVRFIPPAEFVEMLNTLGPGTGAGEGSS